jgi:predicted alpha/beta superfamily hydrolase
MSLIKSLLVTTLALIISTCASADDGAQYKEVLQSKYLNEEREFTIKLPQSYSTSPDKTYPVLYRVDGKGNIPLIAATIDRLNKSPNNAAPELIIVAIENPDRTRDLTPTVNQDPRGPVGLGGGADKFLDFIEMELMPHINQKYRTHDFKIIAGGSIGGLLAIHSLQSRPHLFQAHLAYSPAVWWGDRTTVKKTKKFISSAKDLDNYLYMNIGEESGEVRDVYDDFETFMLNNKPKNLRLVTDTFHHVTHGLTSTIGLAHAYQNLFLSMRMPNREMTNGIESVKQYYEKVSLQRGEKILPPEWVIRELGYYSARTDDSSTALKLFKYNLTLYPDLSSAHNGLAYIYETLGQFEKGLKEVDLALKLEKEGDNGHDVYVQRRERLIAAINQTKG